MSANPSFVPADFEPPTEFTVGSFRLEPLGPQHNERDYAAWMSSIDHIRRSPGFPDGSWPHEMSPEEKEEVEDLLEFSDDTAGGLMNTSFLTLPEDATVAEAMAELKKNEDILEYLHSLFLVDSEEHLKCTVPLARLFDKDLVVVNCDVSSGLGMLSFPSGECLIDICWLGMSFGHSAPFGF